MIELILLLLLAMAMLTFVARDLLASVVFVSVFSLLSCLLFFVLHAPDVALTEAAVGTGIGSVVLIWIVHKTERRTDRGARR